MKTWKRRWFILTHGCLYYFEFTTVSKRKGRGRLQPLTRLLRRTKTRSGSSPWRTWASGSCRTPANRYAHFPSLLLEICSVRRFRG